MINRRATPVTARVLKFVVDERGEHLHVRVFEAPLMRSNQHASILEIGTFACCGTLVMREPEWTTMRDLLFAGAAHLGFELHVDERGAGLGQRSII